MGVCVVKISRLVTGRGLDPLRNKGSPLGKVVQKAGGVQFQPLWTLHMPIQLKSSTILLEDSAECGCWLLQHGVQFQLSYINAVVVFVLPRPRCHSLHDCHLFVFLF